MNFTEEPLFKLLELICKPLFACKMQEGVISQTVELVTSEF